jgi:sigma-B regulation protein RsbU (phosphoserine phosphatase)
MPTAPPPPPPAPPLARARLWYARQSRLARVTLWLLGIFAVARMLLGILHGIAVVVLLVSALPLAICLLLLLWRWFNRRVLWSVRNRLTVTYLLMGLAPIVLFTSLGGIALYLFAGQYSTNTALADLDEAGKTVAGDSVSAVVLSQHLISDTGKTQTPVSISVLRNGNWQPLLGLTSDSLARPGEPIPAWLLHSFRGIVERDGRLYLCAADTANTPHGPVEIFGSRPLDEPTLSSLDPNLGVLRIFSHDPGEDPGGEDEATPAAPAHHSQVALKGGSLPPAANLIDAPIYFTAPIPIYAWSSGQKTSAIIVVGSRPTILYHRLFANSFSGGAVARTILLTVIVTFAVLELFAVIMAIAFSRTIVGSVAALYRGTRAIDAGNLEHRVPVLRHDQLADLARSFNRMAGSIADLLIQQREKDKLLNELSIAQEVQRTLFPPSPASGAGLELHAVCVPALTVGGDYYDFIFGPQNAVCLTLGDISGKGMSAALLMASLHSSIRALSFDTSSAGGAGISPAAMMETINRSLYRSTQSSRYATLFAACYAAETRGLTYSNGGHLPPIILTASGAVERLQAGGPVVGLLPGMAYSEATVQMHSGDLLIAFTDGVTEPEKDAEQFGEQRLIDLIQPIRNSPLPVIMAAVLKAVKQWIGDQEQPDDITLLLARQL